MKDFFKDFLREYKVKIIFFSFLRIFSLIQALFWPFALAKIVNIMTETPEKWKEAMMWVLIRVVNNVTEDLIRLRSKYGLEKLGTRLEILLTTFFSEKTKILGNKKTGEAVQAIKKAGEHISALILFYKENALLLPVNFIIIPIVLFKASPDYLIFLGGYALIYLIADWIGVRAYHKKLNAFLKTSEIFWGTTYRKAPEVWRKREDGEEFAKEVHQEGDELYLATISANNTNKWRWFALQAISSMSICGTIFFVLYRMANNHTHIGDLVLISSYFQQMQLTLNVLTTSFTQVLQTKMSLKRLDKTVKIR